MSLFIYFNKLHPFFIKVSIGTNDKPFSVFKIHDITKYIIINPKILEIDIENLKWLMFLTLESLLKVYFLLLDVDEIHKISYRKLIHLKEKLDLCYLIFEPMLDKLKINKEHLKQFNKFIEMRKELKYKPTFQFTNIESNIKDYYLEITIETNDKNIMSLFIYFNKSHPFFNIEVSIGKNDKPFSVFLFNDITQSFIINPKILEIDIKNLKLLTYLIHQSLMKVSTLLYEDKTHTISDRKLIHLKEKLDLCYLIFEMMLLQ